MFSEHVQWQNSVYKKKKIRSLEFAKKNLKRRRNTHSFAEMTLLIDYTHESRFTTVASLSDSKHHAQVYNRPDHRRYVTQNKPTACWSATYWPLLTCVSVENLAAVGGQLKHLELRAVCRHYYVTVLFSQEPHIQDVIIIAHKLQKAQNRQ